MSVFKPTRHELYIVLKLSKEKKHCEHSQYTVLVLCMFHNLSYNSEGYLAATTIISNVQPDRSNAKNSDTYTDVALPDASVSTVNNR